MTNVQARFFATWPNGAKTAFGLNEERPRAGAVLYTTAVGATTHTSGGRDLILERNGTNSWLPLRPGVTYTAKVKEIRENGDAPLTAGTVVLSLGPELAPAPPELSVSSVVQISTDTIPSLAGVTTGIGGGPALVRDGKVLPRNEVRIRNPRAAIGWNNEHIYLVEVDGRQRLVSVGMTNEELSEYMHRLGCINAMSFDGGGSATCWVYGQVMNRPSEGFERSMANSLVLVQKDKK